MRDHYGGRQLGAESRGGALSRLLFFSKKDVSWELKKIRAKAPAAVSSIVWPYFACVITMAAGSWVLRAAAVPYPDFYFSRCIKKSDMAQVRTGRRPNLRKPHGQKLTQP